MKEIKLSEKKTTKAIEAEIKANGGDFISGSISDLKKIGLRQDSEILGVQVKSEPEIIELKDFQTRQELDNYVKDLLGDNLTLNRRNRHSLKGNKTDTDRLALGVGSEVYGLRVIE